MVISKVLPMNNFLCRSAGAALRPAAAWLCLSLSLPRPYPSARLFFGKASRLRDQTGFRFAQAGL